MIDRLLMRINSIASYLLVLPFLGTAYYNILLFPFGVHQNEIIRKAFVYLITIGVAVVIGIKFLSSAGKTISLKLIFYFIPLPLCFALFNFVGMLSGNNKSTFLISVVTGIIYIVSCGCSFLILAANHEHMVFFKSLRIYSLLASPVLCFYLACQYISSDIIYSTDLGVLSYMPLAYCSLTVCILLSVDLLFTEDKKKSNVVVDTMMLALYSMITTASMAKGPIICLIALAILIVCFSLKKKRNCLFSVMLIGITVSLLTVQPSGVENNRIKQFVNELINSGKQMENVSSDQTQVVQSSEYQAAALTNIDTGLLSEEHLAKVAAIVEKCMPGITDNPLNHIVEAAHYHAPEKYECGEITMDEYQTLYDMAEYLYRTSVGGRMFLWTCAFRDFMKSPICGNGILYFQNQYGTYPHNYFLELLADSGVLGCAAVLILGLVSFIVLIKHSKENLMYKGWLIYVLAFLPRYMLSSSCYSQEAFIHFGITVFLMIAVKKKMEMQ